MIAKLEKSVLDQVREEIGRLVEHYKPNAKFRRCLRCQEPFKPRRDDNVFCSRGCARGAHYLKFNVREIRKGR